MVKTNDTTMTIWPRVFVYTLLTFGAIWMLIPAIVLGANGLLFQFCAMTDLWDVWAVLWPIEPLSVGVALLVVGALRHSSGLLLTGLFICGLAGMALVGMTAIFTGWWLINLSGPVILILAGLFLLAQGTVRRSTSAGTVCD